VAAAATLGAALAQASATVGDANATIDPALTVQ